MELSGPGVQYIADNQLYNSIITAHALLMSTPSNFDLALFLGNSHESMGLKGNQAGRAKLYDESQTAKLILMVCIFGNQLSVMYTYLGCRTIRLTKLIHLGNHKGILAKS
jgi:hypothetical protein